MAMKTTIPTPAETLATLVSNGHTLSREQAEALTGKLKGVFSDATLDMIATAYVGKVWKPLDFPTWEAWCDEHLGVRLRLMKPQQDAVVKRLTEAGASSRAVAAVLGISQSTASREQRKAQGKTVTPNKPKTESSDSPKAPVGAGNYSQGGPVSAAQAPDALLTLLGKVATLDVQKVELPELFAGVTALDRVIGEAMMKLAALRSRVQTEVQSTPTPITNAVKATKPTRARKAPAKAAA